MPFIVEASQWPGTRAELEAAIAAHRAAQAAHAFTVNVPAPSADPLVERFARTAEQFELRADLEAPPAEPEVL
jgi:hypothetical protein